MAFKMLFAYLLLNSLTWSATIHDAVWEESNTPLDEIYPRIYLSNAPQTVGRDALNTSLEEGESESNAIKVYIPLEAGNNADYFTRNILPDITSTGGTGKVHFQLQVNLENVYPQYLHAAVKNDDESYTIIDFERNSTPQTTMTLNSNDRNLSVDVSFNELCSVSGFDCAPFITTGQTLNQREEYHLLFFLSRTPYSKGQKISEADAPAKLFYQLHLSNAIDNRNEINLQSLYKGDGQLHPTFDGFSPLPLHSDSLYAHVVESSMPCMLSPDPQTKLYNAPPIPNNRRLQKLDTLSTGGDTDVKNLKNGHCYSVRLLYVDKFGFASRMSRSMVESPEEILSLLERDQCYLLTAGFGREHFVIDFFRSFRDRVLLSFSLGKALVSAYYATAPSYAPLILKSPFLAYSVRGVAYVLYAILRYFPYLLGLGLVGLFSFYRRRNHGRP